MSENDTERSMTRKLTLPTDSAERKRYPIFRGAIRYFTAALAGVARISMQGNEKHNPGQPMHHARGKSTDHSDCFVRHAMDVEDMLVARDRAHAEGEDVPFTDAQILDEVDQGSWRYLAWAQEIHERLGAPLAPAARLQPAVEPQETMAEIATRLNGHCEKNCWCGDDQYHGMQAADRL